MAVLGLAGPAIRKRLGEIAEVRGGYIAPGGATLDGDERVRALQASDLAPDGAIAWPALRTVSPPRDSSRYAVRESDVLLPLRSARLVATVARDVPPDVIALGSWAMLTPTPEYARSAFLAWYLNHPDTSRRLGALAKGSSLQFLSIGAVREFEVELPSLELQQQIVHAHQIRLRVMELERQLADAHARLFDALTMAALRRTSAGPRTSN